MKETRTIRRGDLYLADLGKQEGSRQGGVRPVVILQNDMANTYAPTVTLAPLTSRVLKKPYQPTHYCLRQAERLARPSTVLAEQIETLDKQCLLKYLGTVSPAQMRGIDRAVKIHLSFRTAEAPDRKNCAEKRRARMAERRAE